MVHLKGIGMFEKTIHQKVKENLGRSLRIKLEHLGDNALHMLMVHLTTFRVDMVLSITESCCFELQN